jgi:5'-deoxynucleotidase YfbR-like HD superfamily hydrolase
MPVHELPPTKVPTLEHRLHSRRRNNVLVDRLQNWYDSVERWKSTKAPDGYTETLLGHVRSMNHMVDSVAASPALSQTTNLSRLNLILGVHDLGEVGTGDIDRAKKGYESDKTLKDTEETQYFMNVILPALPYVRPWFGRLMKTRGLDLLPTLEKAINRGFRAYESMAEIGVVRKTHDTEALLAKVMDRMDAVNKGVQHFHVGKEGVEKDDAVLRQLAGANRASSLHLYRMFELLGQKGKFQAMEDLGKFMLDHKILWDKYDPRIFDSPRDGKSYTELLPSFAEVLHEAGRRFSVEFRDSSGTRFTAKDLPEPIGNFLHTANKTPQRL